MCDDGGVGGTFQVGGTSQRMGRRWVRTGLVGREDERLGRYWLGDVGGM